MVYNMVHNMVHDLRKNTVEVQVLFGGARVHQMSAQGARNIVHQNSKFFEPWNWHKELLYSSYILFKFRSNGLMSTFCLFIFLSANKVTFFAIMSPFSVVMFMIECSVTQSDIRIKSDMSTTWKVSKYGVFSGPYFPAFGLNTERYVKRGRREKWEIVQIAFFLIIFVTNCQLTLSWRRSLSYRNQIIDFHSKTMDWFLYYRAVGTSVEKELNALDFILSINDVGRVF